MRPSTGTASDTVSSSSRVVLLDAGPLGQVTHPRAEANREAALWLGNLLAEGVSVRVPEIADY